MLPRFEVVARHRPAQLAYGAELATAGAPYIAVEGRPDEDLVLAGGPVSVTAAFGDAVTLRVTTGAQTTTHRSRRSGRPEAPVEGVALTLTGPQVTAFTHEAGRWVARCRFDLTDRHDVHDESWLAGLGAPGGQPLRRFGQLGLRDLRAVSHADGSPYVDDGRFLLTATSAGPGWFPTGHTSVWSLDPDTLALEHHADVFVRRGGRVFGDHAAHLVRDGERWLLAASTWGDFDPKKRPVRVVLAETTADLTTGTHVLDAEPLPLPVDGFRSVGVWDPHLVRADDGWLVGFVSATRWFRFHPVVANGPDLDRLEVRAVDPAPRETEGTTLLRIGGEWRVLASDKRRRVYPVLDLDLRELGTLDAAYPTNIPWPTLLPHDDGWLLVGFDGTPYGGRLVGYGSHGTVVVQRSVGQ